MSRASRQSAGTGDHGGQPHEGDVLTCSRCGQEVVAPRDATRIGCPRCRREHGLPAGGARA